MFFLVIGFLDDAHGLESAGIIKFLGVGNAFSALVRGVIGVNDPIARILHVNFV